MEKVSPFRYVSKLANSLQEVPPEDVIYQKHSMENFRPKLLSQILNNLIPENMRIFNSSNKIKDLCNKTEEMYQIKYSQEKFSEKQLKLMNEPNPKNKISKQRLGLPDKNVFLPKNLDILENPHLEQIQISPQSKLYFQYNN